MLYYIVMCMYYMIFHWTCSDVFGILFHVLYHYLIIVLKYENTFVIIIKTFTNIRVYQYPIE